MGAEARPNAREDSTVQLTIAGDTYADSIVSFQFNGNPFLTTPQPLFHRFCEYAKGKLGRAWAGAGIEPQMTALVITMPVNITTIEQNPLNLTSPLGLKVHQCLTTDHSSL